MGINIHDPLVQIKITESVCGFVAICMTFLRLWLRRERYWWDDACAFLSLLCLFVQFAAVFMHVDNPMELSRLNRIAAYYLMATTFYAIIWTARLSILFSIIRIDPDPITRRRLRWLAGAFIAAFLFLISQLFYTCENMHDGWKDKPSPQCHLPKAVAICQLVTDILSDLALILLPIRLVRGIKDKRLRWRLFFIFSTSIVTTIVSLVHAAYIIASGGIRVIISALVEDCMSLTVANLPVVATASLQRLSGISSRDANPDGDGQRWSSFKFRTRSRVPGATTASTNWTSGFGGGGGGGRSGAVIGDTTHTELTGTTLEPAKGTMPVGSEDNIFASTSTKTEKDAEKGTVLDQQVHRVSGDGGVVRIDVLSFPREPPPPES